MATVSFIQRLVEGAFDIALTTGRNFAGGATTRINSGASWQRRGRGMKQNFDFHNTRAALEEYYGTAIQRSLDIMRDPNRGILRRGLAGAAIIPRSVLGAGHTTMAAATDLAGGALGTMAGLAGHVVSAPLQVGGLVATNVAAPVIKGTLKGAWQLAKFTGMTPTGVAKGVGMAGSELAKDAGSVVAGTGKFLWKTRKDPIVGTALVGGAAITGLAIGTGDHNDERIYGSAYGGKGTSKAYFNPEIQAPAWQLNYTPSATTNAAQTNLSRAAEEDNMLRGGVGPLYGPFGHDFGGSATGDLVFALHNLRSGGIL